MPRDQNLYAFLAELPIACHELSVAGEIVFVNEVECRLMGLRQDEILGRPVWDFIAPEAQALSREAVRRKMAGEQDLVTFEREFVRRDGTRFLVEVHERHIRNHELRIIGMRSFLIDLTERKRSEEALQESARLYKHVVEHASDIIYRTDLNGRFRMFNTMAPKLLGYPVEQLTGSSYLDLIRPDFRGKVRRFYRRQLARRLSHTYLEFPAVARNGSEIWFGQNVELIQEGGRITGFQAITRDVTQQRRSEEGLKYAQEELERRVQERTAELEEANEHLRLEMAERQRQEQARSQLEAQIQHSQRLESLGVLAGGIAHDFNNLLAVIMGYAGLALPKIPPGSDAHASIEEVISAAKNAAQLTQQMLAYSGRGKFTTEPINLSRLIEDVTRLIATLISKKAVLDVNLAPDLPAIDGDSAQLRQVVINLITNASDALGERAGAIQVTTGAKWFNEGELQPIAADGGLKSGKYVFIEVVDNGCGMDKATVGKIFDPFFTTKFTGRGLGLAAVHGIVRGHHGTLQVESKPRHGTTFRVFFPALEEAIEIASRPEAAPDSEWRPEGVVLVVDDEPAVRALACHILQGAGATVMTAKDGWDAVRQFEAHSDEIRAVLLDLTMPGLDGGEVLQLLVRAKPDVKVILCSGYDVQDVSLKFGPHKPAGFLRKPYCPAELIRSFRSIL